MIERLESIRLQMDAAGIRAIALWGAGKFGRQWFPACRDLLPPIRVVLDDHPPMPRLGDTPIERPDAFASPSDVQAIVVTCDTPLACAIRQRILDLPSLRDKPVFWPALSRDQARLLDLKDRHAGETFFLLGNGPSVRPADLDRLAGRPAFCCNKFFKAYDLTSLRPPYVISADRQMMEDFGADIIRQSAGQVFFAMEERPAVTGDFIWIPAHNHGEPLLDDSFLCREASICSASLIVALQIGHWMGGRRFILYGVDHTFSYEPIPDAQDRLRSVTGEGNHFIADYREGRPWCAPRADLIENGWRAADAALRRQRGCIQNATRGGRLEVLERIPFEEALEA